LRDPEGKVIAELHKGIGTATNNVAEYSGLLAGLMECLDMGIKDLEILSDSELLVRQIEGKYKVKSANLQPLYTLATEMLRKFPRVRIRHIPRAENADADRLANIALDGHLDLG
jgi:ribonuclease HI